MKRTVMMLTVALVVGIAVGIVATQVVMAQQAPITRTILQQKDIEGVAEREVVMYVADVMPGAVAGRHFHPGPEVGYVLQGSIVLEPDGHSAMTLKVGESFHMPTKHIHNAKNASTTEAAKLLVFLVGQKGQPLATPVP
jgi:quercetin dioxygenase-like cupin family protein